MGSIAPEPVPSLTPLELIGPKGYLRYVFTFPLASDYEVKEVAAVLKAGYAAAIQRLPVMDCEAIPDLNARQGGVMKLRKVDNSKDDGILVKDMRMDAFPTYAELRAQHFPVAAFDADTFCRSDVWPTPGEPLPISLVQANFIRGGLILTWCILHMAGDGTSFQTWMQVWAEECRHAQGLDSKPVALPPAIFEDRERVMRSTGRNLGRPEDHPEYIVLPVKPPAGIPPKMLSKDHRAQVFYFSPEALSALKSDASPSNATEPTNVPWISTNDALSALLWRTVMAVQWPVETLEGDPVSFFNIALNGRLRTDPPVHPDTLGCFLEYIGVSMPVRKMLSSASLADLAVLIRQELQRVNNQFTDDVTTLIEGLDDISQIFPASLVDLPGFNCILSSWIGFKLYDIDWGTLLGGHIESVRTPHVGIINGLQIVLPSPPEGGMEVVIGVADGCLERLLNDPLWTKYAVAR
ncbi:hypothetical protein BO94DRAFT_141709 [Aspergillus sclerotioniger CBS 115572]|uniref:Trichothecene 3-O-acetyltransferase-like N-terminal domain-containing protein n=1 Tax=Aspergillus sclerotioniger CBS 115572 TaxID=1450535 RepID=A0A317XBL5_9EURO|nr:hypothetical protein BO94DRAFT_141709 [Aspergillus sclerotioniger CBS 115572]PWY95943.1 hypothetical protein BO94DRAFT_141709 [Aspergillus sclerotioniger CBS 115572]